jgi:hypothetical protein
MSAEHLIDRPIAAIDKAVAELVRVRALPAGLREPDALANAERAVTKAMLAAHVGRYQQRSADGELFHLELELPEPKVRLRWLGKGKPRGPGQLRPKTPKPAHASDDTTDREEP